MRAHALQFPSMHQHACPSTAMHVCAYSVNFDDFRAQSGSVLVGISSLKPFSIPSHACQCAGMRDHSPSYTSTFRRVHPCATICVHVLQCAAMCILVEPDWFDIFSSHCTLFAFGGCFDTDIKFHTSILHFLRCQFRTFRFALRILYVP